MRFFDILADILGTVMSGACLIGLLYVSIMIADSKNEVEHISETKVEHALYTYPILTEIEQHLLVWKRYEQIDI